MLQRLLFGPHRLDLSYTDLQPRQAVTFAMVLLLVIALGLTPKHWIEPHPLTNGLRAALEIMHW
jgi:NADH:ubiquinone oxidoreductase subunit 4 (subunit M)